MTDTLKRLANPTTLVKNNAGSSLYTPGGSTKATVKLAHAVNSMPWDAYLTLGINDLTVESNLIIPSLLIPAFKSVPVPLDLIVDNAAGDVVKARQSIGYQDVYGNASLLATPASVASASGNAGAASSVVTGSWTSLTDALYLLFVGWRKSAGIGTVSSFTDTRGLTWTILDTFTNAAGNRKIAAYSAVSTSASAATTTVTFSASQDASYVVVTQATTTGTFDATTANGVDGLVVYGAGEDTRGITGPLYIPLAGKGWAGSNRISCVQETGNTTSHAAQTGWTELQEQNANEGQATCQALGTVSSAAAHVLAPTWGAANSPAGTIGMAVEVQAPPRPLAVSLYGVEVT